MGSFCPGSKAIHDCWWTPPFCCLSVVAWTSLDQDMAKANGDPKSIQRLGKVRRRVAETVETFGSFFSSPKTRWSGWWFGTSYISPIVGMMIPSDELIFFRGVGQPPTRWWFSMRLIWINDDLMGIQCDLKLTYLIITECIRWREVSWADGYLLWLFWGSSWSYTRTVSKPRDSYGKWEPLLAFLFWMLPLNLPNFPPCTLGLWSILEQGDTFFFRSGCKKTLLVGCYRGIYHQVFFGIIIHNGILMNQPRS